MGELLKRNFKMKRTILLLSLTWLCCGTAAVAQSIPPSLHARIIQLEDERNLNGDELAKLLKHASPKVRERAALAIGRIGDKRGTAALIELLQTEKGEQVRAMAAFALGEMEDAQAVPALMAMLEPGNSSLADRARPAEALGKIASVPANIELLGKQTIEQISVRLAEQLPDPKATLMADKKLLASLTITALMRVRSASSVEPLTQQLKSDDADLRAQAANALARIRQPIASAVPALLEALNDRDHDVRANAARALGVSKDAQAIEPLIKLLSDRNEQVQVSAVRALAAIGDKRAVEPLIKMGDRFCQQKGEGCYESLNQLLEIVSALNTMKEDRALPLFRRLREVFGEGAYSELEIAIARFGEKEFFSSDEREFQLGGGDTKHIANLAQGMGEIDSELSREMLLLLWMATYLEEPATPQVLRALSKLKPKTLPFLLRDSLFHKDPMIRATAANLISNSIEERNLNRLIDSWAASSKDKENDAKLAILTAIAKYKSEMAVETIKLALADQDHLIRRRAVELLKQMGAGDFSDRIGTVQTGHDKLFYQRVVARMNRKVTAKIHTAKGAITMELFPQDAPLTVDSFVRLARKGYFNNVSFHRVVANFVIQGGDPTGGGSGGPGYEIRCEVNPRPYGRGALGMALSGKDTGGSQFFITHSPQPHLDGGYTVFGQVTSGMEVVDRIARDDVIKRIVISER
jgi:cyclophilin family peptidyl-prolyl cis-trans isomerase/HEAT repeat protein